MGALFLAIFWAASCLRGTFWAVDLRAVCFVLAISNKNMNKHQQRTVISSSMLSSSQAEAKLKLIKKDYFGK
jgi:hypothetical protein